MKYLIWNSWIDKILEDKMPPDGIGGAETQLAMWALSLSKRNNLVYIFSSSLFNSKLKINNITCLPIPWVRKFGVFLLPLKYIYLYFLNVDFIIIRSRVAALNFKLFLLFKKKKIIYMCSSDKEFIDFTNSNSTSENIKFKKFLISSNYIILQNEKQFNAFKNELNLGYKIKLINNIYFPIYNPKTINKIYDFIWVGNIKENKRPEMFLNMAMKYVNFNFAMIGKEDNTYLKNLSLFMYSENFIFLGYLSLYNTIGHISKSRFLVLTSIIEGFPNVLIQAWYFNIPVISTVDPNDIITKFNLGWYVKSEECIHEIMQFEVTNNKIYNAKVESIKLYFSNNHNYLKAYEELISFIDCTN